jgi:hypothetical protein
MSCGCNDITPIPSPSQEPCNPCIQNVKCGTGKMDAECVVYHIDDVEPTHLINLGIENKTPVSFILEAIDKLLGTNFNTPLTVEQTPSVHLTANGSANHTLKADVILSSKNGNSLIISDDGLYASTSSSDGKVKVNAEDVPAYLENQLNGGTDGIVSVSTVTKDGQVAIIPIISIPNLIEKIRTDYFDLFGTLIYQYITNEQYYSKLAPYIAYEYYGSLTNFDGTGKGIASQGYDKVYICNGLNGTPDKRGRVGVGANVGVPGGALDPAVNPNLNIGYEIAVTTKLGEYKHALSADENGQHTHGTSQSTHSHLIASLGTNQGHLTSSSQYVVRGAGLSGNSSYDFQGTSTPSTVGKTSDSTLNLTINNSGLGVGHNNVQPSIGALYIMYIP